MGNNKLRCSDKAFISCCYAAAGVIIAVICGIACCIKTIFDALVIED